MKQIKKVIAVLLTVLMLSSFALPVVSFAAAEATTAQNDHTSFEDFWEQMTGDDGEIDWAKLPKVLFKAFVMIRFVEVIIQFFRGLFGGSTAETTTAAVA